MEIRYGIKIAPSKNMDSILDNNNLDDFIAIAHMDDHEFAGKQHIHCICDIEMLRY